MRSRCVAVRALVLGFLLAGWVAAAAPPAKVERVTVKKADGTTVAGELVSADHDGLIVQPPGKTGVLVGWKDVASVSNGLTRGQAVSQWKAKRQDQLCGTCEGNRTVKHEACAGTGVDPAAKKPCPTCKETGAAGKCTNPKCKEGKVDCPGPCLKLSVGTWKKKDDGKLWREFKMKGNRGYNVSEGHVGEVWNFTGAEPENKGKCGQCNGTAKVDCGTCAGRAHLPCKACRGAGATGPACKECKEGQTKCADCKGAGVRS